MYFNSNRCDNNSDNECFSDVLVIWGPRREIRAAPEPFDATLVQLWSDDLGLK